MQAQSLIIKKKWIRHSMRQLYVFGDDPDHVNSQEEITLYTLLI